MQEREKICTLFKLSIIIAVAFAACFYGSLAKGISWTVFSIVMAVVMCTVIFRKNRRMRLFDIFYCIAVIMLGAVPALADNTFCFDVSVLLNIIVVIKWAISVYKNIYQFEFLRNIVIMFTFCFEAFGKVFYVFEDIGKVFKRECDKSSGEDDEEKETLDEISFRDKNKSSYRKQIIIGVMAAVPLLIIVLLLLASSDVVFRNIISGMFIRMDGGIDGIVTMIKWIVVAGVGFLMAYGCGRNLISNRVHTEAIEVKKADVVMGITFSGIFAGVYVLFCMVQLVTIFSGGKSLPEGYTYAKYARTGFFQLLFVCMINVGIVLVSRIKFNMNKILRNILIVISVCTYLMIFSSAYRMILYIKAYHLTFLRILVLWALSVIAVIMGILIAFIYKEKVAVFEYGLAAVVVMFLGLVTLNPDRTIAEYNLAHLSANSRDIFYLTQEISYDGAESVIRTLPTLQDGAYKGDVKHYCNEIIEEYERYYKGDIRRFNVSMYRAYRAAVEYKEKE